MEKPLGKIFSMHGKSIIVTGAAQGNGFAIASALIEAGANVIRVDKNFSEKLKSDDRQFDLEDIGDIGNLVSTIAADYKKIDGLVNNAGVSYASTDPYRANEIFDRTFQVNMRAALSLCAELLPIMANSGGGSIVNVTSLGASLGFPDNPSYQMSKAALAQLTKAIARDWGDKGIRANNLVPGYIRTAMTEGSYTDPQRYKQRLERTLLKRWGESTDLCGPAIFLLSDASSYITGSDIWVDGGWHVNGL